MCNERIMDKANLAQIPDLILLSDFATEYLIRGYCVGWREDLVENQSLYTVGQPPHNQYVSLY